MAPRVSGLVGETTPLILWLMPAVSVPRAPMCYRWTGRQHKHLLSAGHGTPTRPPPPSPPSAARVCLSLCLCLCVCVCVCVHVMK